MNVTDANRYPAGPVSGNRRGAARRRAILKAARDLFLEQGFDAVTIDAIVARAGGSKATIYSYFGNKEGLFNALMTEVHDEIGEHSSADLGFLPPREALTRIALESLNIAMSEQVIALYRLACSETRRFPQLGETFWKSGPTAILERLTVYLREQTKRGRIYVSDPAKAAAFFQGMIIDRLMVSVSLGVKNTPNDDEAASFVDEAVAMFLSAYERSSEVAVAS